MNRNSKLKTCSDLKKMTPHFQKFPHFTTSFFIYLITKFYNSIKSADV